MPANMARGIGIDFGAGGCRLAVQEGASRVVCSIPPPRGVESPKRHIGMQRPGNDARATEILRSAREEAKRQLRAKITGGMLAVPPCFSDRQKAAAKACAEGAGFKNVALIDEPVAGAVFYMRSIVERGRWLVYGLGKSTFFATLLDTREKIAVIAHNGDVQFGGDDFDGLLAEEIRRRWLAAVDLETEPLLQFAERCKRLLSFQEEAIIQDLAEPAIEPVCFTFRRDDLEALLDESIGRTLALVRQTLADGQTSPDEIDRVLLLGDSTRIPMVKRRLRDLTAAPIERLSKDAVCRGAAIVATSRLGDCFQMNVEPGIQVSMPPAVDGPMKTYAAMSGTSGGKKLELYYQFLEDARRELAYIYIREASGQDGLGRTKDAVATLERFLEGTSTAGKDAVSAALADYYYRRARNAYDRARAAKRDDDRRSALKDCKSELRACLLLNSKHADAIRLKAALAR